MRGKKAKRLRRELPPTTFSKSEWNARPGLYTHPIDNAPGRAERRRMMREYRAYLVRAARFRNREAKRRGVPTPAQRITTALRLAGAAYHESDPSSAWALFRVPTKDRP